MMRHDGFRTSAWYFNEGLVSSGLLQRGDLLEFERITNGYHLYSHWAVFIGDPIGSTNGELRVIHLSDPEGDFGIDVPQMDQSAIRQILNTLGGSTRIFSTGRISAEVRSDSLSFVAKHDRVRINNAMDEGHKVYCPAMVVQRAEAALGKGNYNLVTNNCEHFCRHCRYDEHRSIQVVSALKNIVAPVLGGIATVAGVVATVAIIVAK